MRKLITNRRFWAVTLLELLVVVLILSILATIATGVYTGEANRARVAAAKDLIHQLSVSIARYEVDCGALPPSGSASTLIPPAASSRRDGSGYLHLALVYSMSGSANKPASTMWRGPYINLQADQIGVPSASVTGTASSVTPGMVNVLDPWKSPILYFSNGEYTSSGSLFSGGTALFVGSAPTGANPALPAPNPYVAQGETYYNTNTYQLISYGPDGQTLGSSSLGSGVSFNYKGTAEDDITNFGY